MQGYISANVMLLLQPCPTQTAKVIAPIDSNDTGLKLVDNSRSALPDKGIDKLANPGKSAISSANNDDTGSVVLLVSSGSQDVVRKAMSFLMEKSLILMERERTCSIVGMFLRWMKGQEPMNLLLQLPI